MAVDSEGPHVYPVRVKERKPSGCGVRDHTCTQCGLECAASDCGSCGSRQQGWTLCVPSVGQSGRPMAVGVGAREAPVRVRVRLLVVARVD